MPLYFIPATGWVEAVPVKGRTNTDTLRAFQQVFGDLKDVNSFAMDVGRRYAPRGIREMYCDKAREFISVCKRVGIPVEHSTLGMPRTNAIAESKVKLVLHGARVALRQAGLNAKFWPYACRHFCHSRRMMLLLGMVRSMLSRSPMMILSTLHSCSMKMAISSGLTMAMKLRRASILPFEK